MQDFFSHTQAKQYAVLEVESGSVACLIYESSDKKPGDKTLLFEKRIHIDVKQGFTLSAIIEELPKVLRKLTDDIAAFGLFEQVYVGLGAPWAYVAHNEAKQVGTTPFTITKKIQTEVLHNTSELDSKLSKTIDALIGPFAKHLIVRSVQVDSARINGYPVTSYIGKKANTFSALVTQHLVIDEIEAAITKTIAPLSKASLITTDLVSIFTSGISSESALVVDVGSYTTELSFVRAGKIERYDILPYGVETAIRALALANHISRGESDSLIAVTEEHIKAQSEEGIPLELRSFCELWQQAVREYVHTCEQNLQMINAILIGTAAHEELFLSLLKGDSYLRQKERKYQTLAETKSAPIFTNGVPRDPRLGILVGYFEHNP